MRSFEDKFESVKQKGEEFYRQIGKVKCPYLNAEVSFNSKGLEHLKFKSRGKARTQEDQYARFKLIRMAPKVLQLSRTVQDIGNAMHFEKKRVHNRVDNVLLPVTYYGFVAVLEDVRIKVIVKQIEDGEYFFWSIIPFWGVDRNTFKRKLYVGHPEND